MNWREEVDRKIKDAMNEMYIHESWLKPSKFLSAPYPYKISFSEAIYLLIDRQNKLADAMGLEFQYQPPTSETVVLVKKKVTR